MPQMPQMLWLNPGLFGAIVGAIALAVIGFTQLGWLSSGRMLPW